MFQLANFDSECAAPPKRIQRSRKRGWRMPAGAVYVGRPTKWGNPYRATKHRSKAAAVAHYRQMLLHPHALAAIRRELRGKDLACWCKPGEPCHADVLLELANGDVS
jgi:hypothetical protein